LYRFTYVCNPPPLSQDGHRNEQLGQQEQLHLSFDSLLWPVLQYKSIAPDRPQ